MTDKELKTALIFERAKRLQQYDDAYPDVGMGYHKGYYFDEAMKHYGFGLNEVDRNSVIDAL